MPCYLTQYVRIELDVADATLLRETLDAMGVRTYDSETYYLGQATITINQDGINANVPEGMEKNYEAKIKEIKTKYATKALHKSAQKAGWRVTRNANGTYSIAKASTKLTASVLGDGRVKLDTGHVGAGAIHESAENLLKKFKSIVGPVVKSERNKRPDQRVKVRR